MHYVIGDVHGCFDEMTALVNKIEEKDKDAVIIFVGDFIDRGPKVWDTLEWMRAYITDDGKYQCILGNHEQMVIEWYEQEWIHWWSEKQTMPKGQPMRIPAPRTTYDFYKQCKNMNYLYPPKLEPIIRFFKSLPIKKRLDINGIEYTIVHAWIPPKHIKLDPWAEVQYVTSHRHKGGNLLGKEVVVHGHTPTVLTDDMNSRGVVPGMISYDVFEINVDGGCVFNKYEPYPCMLCAICLETLEEIYCCSLEERFLEKDGIAKDIEEAYTEAENYREAFFREIPYRREILEKLK